MTDWLVPTESVPAFAPDHTHRFRMSVQLGEAPALRFST